MIVICKITELNKYKKIIDCLPKSNFQQTFDNIKAIHKSNNLAKTYIDNDLVATFIPKNDNTIECVSNIEPVIGVFDKKNIYNFLNKIYKAEKKNLYFPLVYENSNFYKEFKNDFYSYERLYTSIVRTDNYDVSYSFRSIKKFEKDICIKYFKKQDVKKWIIEIDSNSWKHEKKQDMTSKKSQLIYYNELVKKGVATIAVSFTKKDSTPIAYRLDAVYNNTISILKNSYKEEYHKYSPGSYMLLYDAPLHYKDYSYIDLYGGPGLAKKMITTFDINRYDMFFKNENIKDIEENRKRWDKKNYDVFIQGKSIKEVFNKKENVLIAASCFGLGPVGKLNAIIEYGKDKYNWYASGEKFDFKLINTSLIKDSCFSLEKNEIRKFVDKYNIKYAIVVLKNKMARLLKELGLKVVYVDSLPFMWSPKDAEEGKIPYDVDVYCAQKTLNLNAKSKELFSKVKNLVWVNPIINVKTSNIEYGKKMKTIIINIGGLHSPSTDGFDYVEIVIPPLLEVFKNKRVIITTSTKSSELVSTLVSNYPNVKVKTYNQGEFLEIIKKVQTFITSPGLTTILESSSIRNNIIFLPPQNISQFYNIEFGKKVFKNYKEITWDDYKLSLDGLKEELCKDEHEVIEEINLRIKEKKSEEYKDYIKSIVKSDYVSNSSYTNIRYDGAKMVIDELDYIIGKDLI